MQKHLISGNDFDIETTNYLMNEGYKSRAFSLLPKKKKKRKEEYKVNDFVDSMKFIDASSSDEEDPYKKAAREELESDNPDENKNERTDRLQRINKKPITQKSINRNPVIPSFKKLISIKPKA